MTDVTPELLARLRDLAEDERGPTIASWLDTATPDVVVALVAEVERLRGVVGRDGVDGHPCIRVEAYVDLSDRLAAAEGAVERVRAVADEWQSFSSRDSIIWHAGAAVYDALEGAQEAATADLSAERPTSGQGGHPDEFEAWIGRAMIGEEQGWGA